MYRRLQAKENRVRRGGCAQYTLRSLCNRNPTCSYWVENVGKLIVAENSQNYRYSEKLCSQKFGGILANCSNISYSTTILKERLKIIDGNLDIIGITEEKITSGSLGKKI